MRKKRIVKIALRVAARKAKRQGDSALAAKIQQVVDDPTKLIVASALLDEESDDDAGLLEKILRWIVENPEEFKDLIEFIIGLFTGSPA